MDSYSTETVSSLLYIGAGKSNKLIHQGELEHRTPKTRYKRTDKRLFVHQLTHIERREVHLQRLK